jgi:iron complex transport system substrate-binding protein
MVTAAGGVNALGVPGEKSARATWDAVRASAPDIIVAAPCGYHLDGAAALAQKAIDDGNLPHGIPVWAVDANASFARPGPRLVDGVEALAGIFHPGTAEAPEPQMARRLR